MIKLRSLLSELDEPNVEPIHVLGKGQRSPEHRERNWIIAINKKIANYIKDGCRGDLDLRGAPIKKLPSELKKVGNSLWLQRSKIEELPDGLHIKGALNLSNTPIKKLPNGLRVDEWMSIGGTQIEELPKDLYVGGDCYIYNTPLHRNHSRKQIIAMVPDIKYFEYSELSRTLQKKLEDN